MKDTLLTISKEQLENRAREKSNMLSDEQTQMYAQKAKKKIILFSIIIAAFCVYAIVFSILFMQKIFVSIVYLLGLFADAFVSFKLLHKSDKELAIFSLKSEIKKSYHLEYISQELPSVEKTISVNANNCSTILIDETKQKLIFQKGRKISEAISFSAITGYDVYENDESKVSGTVGKALIGGVFFGLGGMIVGSSMGRKISNQCEQLKLIIHISNLNCPQIVLSFVDKKCKKSSSAYRKKIENLQYMSFYTEFCKNELPATSLCKKILDESREFYSNFSCVKNNFQCLCHVLQYYGAIRAINIFLPNFDTNDYFDDMSVGNDLQSFFETINNFQMNEEWLERFVDKAWNIIN